MSFEKELQAAKVAAQKARVVLLEHFGRLKFVEAKEQAGLVSEADRSAEATIKKYLEGEFPAYGFLGEEETYLNPSLLHANGDTIQWVVDPLDGTTNYIHRFPIFCISIALVKNKQPVVGVIDVPILNNTCLAVKGQGAYLDGQKISVSPTKNLNQCLAATGFNSEKENVLNEQLHIFDHLVRQTRGVRRPGAAAYDLCMVASGVFDFFWEQGLSPWDVAAGQLLVEEAGGTNSTFSGGAYDPWQNALVSSNSLVHGEIVKIIDRPNDSEIK